VAVNERCRAQNPSRAGEVGVRGLRGGARGNENGAREKHRYRESNQHEHHIGPMREVNHSLANVA